MINLAAAIRDGLVLLDPVARDLDDALAKVVALCASKQIFPVDLQDTVLETLQHRQEQASTAIGHGVAIPHAYVDGVVKPVVVFVRLKRGIDIGAIDHQPTRFLFVLIGPTGQVDTHLDTLAAVARAINDDEVRYELAHAANPEDVQRILGDFYRRETLPEPSGPEEVAEGLRYSGRWFGGLMNDLKRRLPSYRGDLADGLHPKSITATLFLYFACLAPAVTFGGLMFVETGGQIGATEMLVATAICGTVYALTAGQPLIILGGTGPLLVFTAILYQLCRSFELPFLPCYAWVGLWTAALTILLAVTDASCLIQKFTRFTDEIFAGLISLIFIVEALKSIFGYMEEARSAELAHDVAFLSMIMALGTFIIAMMLSRIRSSRYLIPQAREFLADFGPSLAVVLMLLFGALFSVTPEPLDVPQRFGTSTGRQWMVSLWEVPRWVWWASAGPALLATVLIYLDQNITARIINSPDNKLQKGSGYHLDLAVVGVLTGFCSILGLPWLVAATVRSLNHVRALATVEETISPAGDRYDAIVHVRENRVTGLAVHLLIGASLFLLPLLQTVPKAVLYGLFLYMGIVSIAGNQMFERVGLWLTDPTLYPRNHYMRTVPIRIIHRFTIIQAVCLAILWLVKVSAAGILFPMFIALLVPLRMLLSRFFRSEHLAALDAEQLPKEEDTEWV